MNKRKETPKEKALRIWIDMTPAQRLFVMEKVKYSKSLATWHRRCIAYIATEMVEA